MNRKTIETTDQLLRSVRACFVLQGSSLSAWCKENGIVRRTAEQSLNGENRSDNAYALAAQICIAAGLDGSDTSLCG